MATLTITGTDGGDISDGYMLNTGLHTNTGGRNLANCVTSGAQDNPFLIKIATSALPAAASVTTFRFDGNWFQDLVIARTESITAHRVLIDWGEGGQVLGPAQAGEFDWIDAKHGSVAWTTAGAKSEGNDVAAAVSALPTVSVPAASYSTGDAFTWSMTDDALTWPVNWYTGVFDNYGMVWDLPTGAGLAGTQLRTSENATSQPSFFLDYASSLGGSRRRDRSRNRTRDRGRG